MKKTVIVVSLIMFPFAVSVVLLTINGFDCEYMGFWGILQSGPFVLSIMKEDRALDGLWAPLISQLTMISLAFWAKGRSWKTNIWVCVFVLGWYGISVYLFITNLVIA